MHMERRTAKLQLATLVLMSLILLTAAPEAVWAGQALPREGEQVIPGPFKGYDLENIYIFYDPRDEIHSAIAEAVHEILTYRVNGVHLVPITKVLDLDYWLNDEPWIAVYSFQTCVQGVIFEDYNVTWSQFHQLLREHQSTQHVLGMGNTLSLSPRISPRDTNLWHSDSEQIDGLLLILYDIWTIADIIDTRAHRDRTYERAGQDLRAMATKLYTDNMEILFNRHIEPVDTVGEEDPVALKKRTEEMYARHEATIRPAAYEIQEDGSLEEVPLDDLPEDFSPAIKLSSKADVGVDDFILGEIPLFSALRGPIGEIIDILLNVLGSESVDTISIPGNVMENLATAFEVIGPIVGIVDNFDADSPLKSIIEAIASEFPFIAEFKDYLNIMLKALFNLRGDLGQLIDIVLELVVALLPDVIPDSVTDFIMELLGVGEGLGDLIADTINEGKGVYDTIFGFFTKNSLTAILNKTLAATMDLLPGEVSTLLPRIVSFVTSTVEYLTSNDFTKFITNVGTDLLSSLLDMTGLEGAVDRIMSMVKMVMSAIDLIDSADTDDMIQLVTDMITTFIPSGLTQSAEDFARNMMAVVKIYKEGSLSDLNAFKSEIMTAINNAAASVDQDVKDLVQNVITLIAGFFNDGFTKSALPDIFEIAEDVVDLIEGTSSTVTLAQGEDLKNALNNVVKPVMGIIAMVSDNDALKSMVSKTVSDFESELGNLPDMIETALEYMDLENAFDGVDDLENILDTASEVVGGVINMIQFVKGQSFQGIMQSLLMTAGSLLGSFPAFDDVPLDAVLDLLKQFFPKAFGIDPQDLPSPQEIVNTILNAAEGLLSGIIDTSLLRELLTFFMDVKDIFTDGVKWLIGKVLDWLGGLLNPVFDDLESMILGIFSGLEDLLGYSTKIPIGLGSWSLFDLRVALGIKLNFNIDLTPLFDLIVSMIFDARSTFSLDNIGDFFKTIFSFFEISPQFYAELGVEGFDSSKNAIMGAILATLGLELSFEGSAKFVLNLFTFRGGMFEWENFFKVVEWALHIKITIGKTFTLADIFTMGLGGGALAAVMEFLGLDMISITIYFAITIDIVKKAATAVAPEVSSLALSITFGLNIHIPIDLLIVAIIIDVGFEIILTFFQDFASGDPLKITLRLIFKVKVKFRFLMFDDSSEWTWEPGGPWDLSPKKGEQEYNDSGQGFDDDGDGLSDSYEDGVPGLDKHNPDTDGDGAGDKLEVQTMKTDPVNPDTDFDGLSDGEEWELGTNALVEDTDWDDLTDYEEVKIYGTDPFSQDTDGDMLTDAYEVYTRWNMSGITPTVEYVNIGGTLYDDHTDPLNPDTDGDTINDGQEGPGGAYYGLPTLYNDTYDEDESEWVMDPNPLIFNYGYTHPLDADTDDDSWLQLYNGDIDMMLEMKLHPKGTDGQEYPMNDGAEIRGFDIILYDEEGEPYNKHVYTNPCNPDTDGDTGIGPGDRDPPPAGAWLNSDGYELAQDPPSDPTDGDSDDDGLLDGLEGVLRQDSNHTFYLDADTDDDGLPDMQDLLLGTDPLSPDTDLDMVADGDEFYIYGTSPVNPDTDFDGLSDGEELFFWHTNPFSDDSDGDMLLDGYEVLVTGSDPMDEDSDNDGLNDYYEFFVYYTKPFVWDSDGDGLSDGQEILEYNTDPLVWDTDKDTIRDPDEFGDYTWPMSDYDEVMIYGTNATNPDSDMDGLDDGIELYLGSGEIPWMDPIPLDPLNKDTDGDWLTDGSELILENVSDITYPYVGVTVILRYNTSPVVADTDNDTLTDYQEVVVFNTNPVSNDSDNDTITDWWEVWVYNTSAYDIDSDGDGLYDNEETLTEIWPWGPWPPTNWSIGIGEGDNGSVPYTQPYVMADFQLPPPHTPAQGMIHPTSATDPDSDDDHLPDGAEYYIYGSNYVDDDTDNDGILDTYEFDTDYDGLPDGVEFQIGLQGTMGGGIMNPDSDADGLLDGEEYYVHGTDPAKLDTDGDGYSDGLEVALGLDPLMFTTKEEFDLFLARERGQRTMLIMLPNEGVEVYQDSGVSVVNFTPFQDMWFRYKNDTGTEWMGNVSLHYNAPSGQWQSANHSWDTTGNITLQVFGRNMTGVVHAAETHFIVLPGLTPFPWLLVLGIAGIIVGAIFVSYVGHRRGWWSRLGERLGRGKGEEDGGGEEPDKGKPTKKKKTKSKKKSRKKKSTSSKKGKKGE